MRKNVLKFPDQVKIKEKLQSGDKLKLAERTGYKEGTIREMLNGYRRMPDSVKKAIIDLINDRQALDNAIDEIINQ